MTRTKYNSGQVLTAADLKRDQDYHIEQNQTLAKNLLRAGVIDGLNVMHGKTKGQLLVSPGLAIDGSGNFIDMRLAAHYGGAALPMQRQRFMLDFAQHKDLQKNRKVWFSVARTESDVPGQDEIDETVTFVFSDYRPDDSEAVVIARITVKVIRPPAPPPAGANAASDGKMKPKKAPPPPTIELTIEPDAKPAEFYIDRLPDITAEYIKTGTFTSDVIPTLDAAKIGSGTLDAKRLPDLSGDYVKKGSLTADEIPNLDAAKIATGTINIDRLPDLSGRYLKAGDLTADALPKFDAAKIATGTLDAGRLPSLDAAMITTGTLAEGIIPPLEASKITSGTINIDRLPDLSELYLAAKSIPLVDIPNLDASKITTGTIDAARLPDMTGQFLKPGDLKAADIPPLDASKIATGTLDIARIPAIPADKITGLPKAQPPQQQSANILFYTGSPTLEEAKTVTFEWLNLPEGCDVHLSYEYGWMRRTDSTKTGEISGSKHDVKVFKTTTFTSTILKDDKPIFQQQLTISVAREEYANDKSHKIVIAGLNRSLLSGFARFLSVLRNHDGWLREVKKSPHESTFMVDFAPTKFFEQEGARFSDLWKHAKDSKGRPTSHSIVGLVCLAVVDMAHWNELEHLAPEGARKGLETFVQTLAKIGQDDPMNMTRYQSLSDAVFAVDTLLTEEVAAGRLPTDHVLFDMLNYAEKKYIHL